MAQAAGGGGADLSAERRCGNCAFYANGECRRYPPTGYWEEETITGAETMGAFWPPVPPTATACGEWEPELDMLEAMKRIVRSEMIQELQEMGQDR